MANKVHIITDHQESQALEERGVDGSSVSISGEHEFNNGGSEPDAVGEQRQIMILEITKRLKEKQKKTGPSNNTKSIALAAKQIEAILFATASSMEEYRDPSTLRARFHQMVTDLLERRLQKARAAAVKSTSHSYRLNVISSSSNPEIARQVFFLVKQIEFLQVGRPSQDQEDRALDATAIHTTRVTAPSFNLGGQQTVPKPVRDLFFEASILRAFYCTPLERLKDIPWKKLIASTRKEIREYHEWIAQSKAETR